MANILFMPGQTLDLSALLKGIDNRTPIVKSANGSTLTLVGQSGIELRIQLMGVDDPNADVRWPAGTITSVTLVQADVGETVLRLDNVMLRLKDFGAYLDAGSSRFASQYLLSGNDTFNGTKGNDKFYASGGKDVFLGGEGVDRVDFNHVRTEGYTKGVFVDFETGTGNGIDGSLLQFSGIEEVFGTNLDDEFLGDAQDNIFFGASGNDFIKAKGGNDTLSGGDGNDTLEGGSGKDDIQGGSGTDVARFNGLVGDFSFRFLASGAIEVTDRRGVEGIDTVTGVESFQFGDGTFSAATLKPVSIADQKVNEEAAWSLALPKELGTGGITVAGIGAKLPAWIEYDSLTRTLRGTPPQDFNGTIGIQVTGTVDGYQKSATFNLTVAPVNDTPEITGLSGATIQENSSSGKVVGHLSSSDPDKGDSVRYTLVDDADGRFKLNGEVVQVANGAKLDYEQAKAHVITVEVADKSGATSRKSFTINVSDVVKETVKGGADGDTVKGGSKDDKLGGGLGKDVLTGGKGKDAFVFDTKASKTNVDAITDFSVKDDSIQLDNSAFAKLGKAGSAAKPAKLNKDFFTVGSKAKDKNDYLVYDGKKGVLLYDADGSGKGAAVEIATLSKNLKMTAADFFVI